MNPVRNLALGFLEASKRDFESSQLLYEAKHYNNSIFMLQQSVEKLFKGFGLLLNIISEVDLKLNINHAIKEIYKKAVKENQESIKDGIEWANSDEGMSTGTMRQMPFRVAAIIYEDRSEFERISSVDYKNITQPKLEELISMFKSRLIETPNRERKNFELFSSYLDWHSKLNFILNSNKDVSDKMNDSRELMSIHEDISDLAYPFFSTLNFLGCLTSKFQQKTRYPSIDNSFNPVSYFDNDNVIVSHLFDLLEIYNTSIAIGDNIISKIDEFNTYPP